MGNISITPTPGCSQYFLFLKNETNETVLTAIHAAFPGIDVSKVDPENVLGEFPAPLINWLDSIEIILVLVLLAFTLKNSYAYGVKQRRFCNGYLFSAFYVCCIVLLLAHLV